MVTLSQIEQSVAWGLSEERSKLMVQEREMEKDTGEPGLLWKGQLSGEGSGKKSGMLGEQLDPLLFLGKGPVVHL